MAKLSVDCPFDEGHLHDDLRANPVRAQARQSFRFGKWRRRTFDRIEPRPQIQQELRIESGADLSGKDEIILVVVADQQGAQADSRCPVDP